ncbi:FHA domain-containing protein [Streptomyces syringium]|uniref:FHA domain-containing protein n=1 Tax=Streptomyces syringium TaxID=76729 RepID=UPI0033D2422B
MPTCPNGHQSAAEDWCEVCGRRMSAAGAATGAVPPPPPPPPGPPLTGASGPQSVPGGAPGAVPGGTSGTYGFPDAGGDATMQAELCPHCRTPREAQAPFCEECRYNFLTQAANPYATPPSQVQGFQSAPPPPSRQTPPPQSFEYHGSRPSQINRPAEPLAPQPQTFGEDDWVLPPPSTPSAPRYGYEGQPQSSAAVAEGAPPPVPSQGPPLAPPAGWVAVIGPDREYFRSMMNRSGPEASGLNLPAYSPELRLQLSGHQVTIGRRRHSTGESPDIDLSRPPEDPGVSHQHAMFVQQPDGSWAVVDQDSTNGTTINGSEDSIQPYVPVPLQDGDRVHVGAWTTITVHRA